jgi:hypothetical protein
LHSPSCGVTNSSLESPSFDERVGLGWMLALLTAPAPAVGQPHAAPPRVDGQQGAPRPQCRLFRGPRPHQAQQAAAYAGLAPRQYQSAHVSVSQNRKQVGELDGRGPGRRFRP